MLPHADVLPHCAVAAGQAVLLVEPLVYFPYGMALPGLHTAMLFELHMISRYESGTGYLGSTRLSHLCETVTPGSIAPPSQECLTTFGRGPAIARDRTSRRCDEMHTCHAC